MAKERFINWVTLRVRTVHQRPIRGVKCKSHNGKIYLTTYVTDKGPVFFVKNTYKL